MNRFFGYSNTKTNTRLVKQFADPLTTVLIRQILGAVAQFDKAMTVAKLRGARDRKRHQNGKCEGRKSILERNPRVVEAAKRLSEEKYRSLRAGMIGLGAFRSSSRRH